MRCELSTKLAYEPFVERGEEPRRPLHLVELGDPQAVFEERCQARPVELDDRGALRHERRQAEEDIDARR